MRHGLKVLAFVAFFFCCMTVSILIGQHRIKSLQGTERWQVETCADVQLVTHKVGDKDVDGMVIHCVNSANPPYPEGISKTAPQAPSETYDAGKPDQGSQ